jgi:hypothetical protein
MLQDIDLSYDRTGALVTTKSLKIGGSLTVAGAPVGSPSTPQPGDHGLIAWTGDPQSSTTSGSVAVNGSLYLARVFIRSTTTVSKVWWINSAAGATATAGQNWVGLINSSGTVLSTGSIDSVAVTNGPQSGTLSVAQSVAAGSYWACLLVNAATPPTIARGGGLSQAGNNVNLTAASFRFAVNGTGLTTIPASITPASNTTTGALALWMGVS